MPNAEKSQGSTIFVIAAAVVIGILVVGAALSQFSAGFQIASAGLVWLVLSILASLIPIWILYFVIRAAVLSALREHERGRAWTVPGPVPAARPPAVDRVEAETGGPAPHVSDAKAAIRAYYNR